MPGSEKDNNLLFTKNFLIDILLARLNKNLKGELQWTPHLFMATYPHTIILRV